MAVATGGGTGVDGRQADLRQAAGLLGDYDARCVALEEHQFMSSGT